MRLVTLFSAVALTAALASPASAQQARYCGGALVANSFYSTVRSLGNSAVVEYHAQIQNQDAQRRTMEANLVAPQRLNAMPVVNPAPRTTLAPYEQKDVVLFTLRAPHPSGSGAPTAAQAGAAISFVCAYR